MSQAGVVDFIAAHPEIPTMFVTNSGTAVPIANTIEILGTAVAAHSIPLQTVGSGNMVTIQVQYASNAGTSVATNAGVASFATADFTVDANGYVTLATGVGNTDTQVDASTPPGTNPVVPNGLGVITVTGGQVAAGTTTNVIRTNSLVANTYTIQIQRSQAVASSTIGDNGVSHFNSTYFTVDSNGFVSLSGSTVGQTITGNTGGALSPTAGNWNIFGAAVAAGTTPVQTSGTGSTLTVQVQRAQAIASTNATEVGLAAFNSTYFTVDGNGFVSISGSTIGQTITGNVGGALSPTSGNWNILGTLTAAGTTPVQTSGSGSTLTVQVQKAQAIASTNATNVGLAAFNSTYFTVDANGFVSISGSTIGQTITGNTGGALSPSGGNWNILGASTAAGSTPVQTSGSGSTLTIQVQKAQAIASTNATNVGLAAFISTQFSVDANGFVALSTAFTQINIQSFTASGTYTPTSGMKYCTIEVLGGGGGGGGSGATTGANFAVGGGGGAGGYARKTVSASTIGANKTVTVGSAGTGASAGANTGGTGGSSSVGSIVSATGGAGGTGTSAGIAQFAVGGEGGVGSSGDLNANGATGGYGWAIDISGIGFAFSGLGANSLWGGGANSFQLFNASQTGNAASVYGSGGGGGATGGSGGPAAGGGAGSAGIVIITEFLSV